MPGEMTIWADVLHSGPTPASVSSEVWRQVRARHLAADGAGDETEILSDLRGWDECLERHAEFEEVIFWLEHDLFDQLLLIRHLHWLSTLEDFARFRLICIDRFPGHPRFNGLGELNPAELASLFPDRKPVSSEQVDLGARLWRAFTDSDPRPFSDLVMTGDTRALPFAAGALSRQLEDFPATADGLARSERQILTSVRDGHVTAAAVFTATAGLEERVFMGDLTLWDWMRHLTAGRAPLLAHDGVFGGGTPSGTFALTDAGRAVLDRQADYVDLNGIDRWMGGVHLTDGRYRWTGSSIVTRP